MAKKGAQRQLAANTRRLRQLTGVYAVALSLFLARLLLRPASTRHWAAAAIGGGAGALALAALRAHARPVYVGGALEDGGNDVTAPGGAVSLFHDAIYVAAAALGGGAVLGDWPLLLLLAFPTFASYKFTTGVLKPAVAAIFTATPEEEEAAAREAERRERARAKAARTGGRRRV